MGFQNECVFFIFSRQGDGEDMVRGGGTLRFRLQWARSRRRDKLRTGSRCLSERPTGRGPVSSGLKKTGVWEKAAD